jgi:DNA recombination protein RmuC
VSEILTAVASALLVALVAVAWRLVSARRQLDDLRRREATVEAPAEMIAGMLQREIEAVRADARAGQDALKQDVGDLSLRVKQELGELRLGVAGELQAVSALVARQLQDGMGLIQSSQTSLNERLDRAAQVVGEVQGSLGKLGEATQRVADVGREIQGLEQVLKSPKIRGGFGETLLAELLAQMLPREHYTLQHGFRSGDKVDAAILVGGRVVPVDAKFPLENFRRMLAEPEEDRRRALRRAFARDVKLRVDEIAKKYIVPDERTFDFALMYVPAESVYYEIVIKDDADDEPIAAYALDRRVVPVSPNSFYAYLQVIVLGLRGLRIEANAREIQSDLGRLGGDLDRVRDHLQKLGGHLGNAQKQFVDAARAMDRFQTKLEAIERKGEADVALGGPTGAAGSLEGEADQPALPGTGP